MLGVSVFVLALFQLFLSRTGPGRLIRAVADDREAAQLSGANYKHVFGIAAAIAFATVALAGIAYGMMTQFAPTSGGVNLLFAFEAVVVGGIGSLWGTLVGGIALGVAQQIGAHINPQYSVLAGNVLFLAVLAIRPQGLFGKRRHWRERPGLLVAHPRAALAALARLRDGRRTNHHRRLDVRALDPARPGTTTLMNFFILVIMATMWNLLAATPAWSPLASRPSSASAPTRPCISRSRA